MKLKNKRFIAILVALMMITSLACQIALAEEIIEVTEVAETEEIMQRVEFVLSEPDDEGYLTASLIIYDATFSGAQFGFSFDSTVLQFVDKKSKEASEVFNDVATLYDYENEKGTHKFIQAIGKVSNEDAVLNMGVYGMPSQASDDGAAVTVGSEGFKLYDFSAKLIKNEDPKFDVLDYSSSVYTKQAFLSDGRENKALSFKVILPESIGESKDEIIYTPTEPEKSLEVKRKERLVDSLILNIGNYAAVDDGYLKWIDDNNKNVIPFIEGDRTYVPLRFIGEAFGAEVDWNSETQEIAINLDETVIKMNIGKTVYIVNGEEKEMDVAPFIKDDRTIVPIRFVSEALDKAVYWDSGMKLVIVTPKDKPWNPDGEAEKDILPDALLIISELVRDIKVEVPEQAE